MSEEVIYKLHRYGDTLEEFEYVQELVRCKECKRKDTFKCWMRNTQVPRYPSGDDFCSYGERREP